jgi:hypothetical protein
MGEEVPWIIWQTQQYNSNIGEEIPWIIWQTQQYNSYMGKRFRGSFDRTSNMPVTREKRFVEHLADPAI